MRQSDKRLLILLCTVFLILTGYILGRTYSNRSTPLHAEELPQGYYCSTDISQPVRTQNGESFFCSQSFQHSIYTADEQKLADLRVTIHGSVSPSESLISHISTALLEEQWDGLTLSELTAEDTATVILFQDHLSVCHFQYRISPEGEIIYLQ